MKFILCESAISFGASFYHMEATRTLVHNRLAQEHALAFSILDWEGSKKVNKDSAKTMQSLRLFGSTAEEHKSNRRGSAPTALPTLPTATPSGAA